MKRLIRVTRGRFEVVSVFHEGTEEEAIAHAKELFKVDSTIMMINLHKDDTLWKPGLYRRYRQPTRKAPERNVERWRTVVVLEDGYREKKYSRNGSEEGAIAWAKQFTQAPHVTRTRLFDGEAFRSPVLFDSNSEKPKP